MTATIAGVGKDGSLPISVRDKRVDIARPDELYWRYVAHVVSLDKWLYHYVYSSIELFRQIRAAGLKPRFTTHPLARRCVIHGLIE